MKLFSKTTFNLFAVAVLAASMILCKKENAQLSSLTIKLTDAPANYQEVNVKVVGVEVHSNTTGWISIPTQDSIYDLLLLQNNANATLGTVSLPSGKISQVRLLLGDTNTVKVNGVIHPLQLSSQDVTGLKLNIHQTIFAGNAYTLVIDFDANQSIHELGNGGYKLKPVLKAEFQ